MFPREDVSADPFEEICGLAETAGCAVVGRVSQRREQPDVSTYFGKGKVEELKRMLEAEMADLVVFDNDLSPGQGRNLEKVVGKRVVDRSQLILDIFAINARTYESRLAVELAQLEYSLPRLRRLWTHLSRISMGVGMRGPGEKQLEVDRRLAQRRIFELKQELSDVEKRRSRQVASRSDRASVSLVGYTNAGKSTLLNALTGANALAEDRLFATLETRTRRWQLPGWGPVLLSDTVGFIRDLPHHLIASFKATLEETTHADLLLHVADAANPNVFRQISAVFEVLRELHIDEKDALLVLNKVDRIRESGFAEAEKGVLAADERLRHLQELYPNAIPISAASGFGLQRLADAVGDALSREFLELEVTIDPGNGKLMAHLAATGEVLQRSVVGEHVVIHCRLPPRAIGLVEQQAISIVRKKVARSEEIRTEEEVA
jgi:GTP-binding protein HflX